MAAIFGRGKGLVPGLDQRNDLAIAHREKRNRLALLPSIADTALGHLGIAAGHQTMKEETPSALGRVFGIHAGEGFRTPEPFARMGPFSTVL